jgi:ATP-dependent exoDNAse (exonuclease V) alpha subunit
MVLDETDDTVAIKGNIPGLPIKIGTWFAFEAEWTSHPKHGRQLTITKAPVVRSSWDAETAVKALVSHGVGDRVARGLREFFGEAELVDALGDLSRLAKAPGMDEFTAGFVHQRWTRLQAYFKGLGFLLDLKLPPGLVKQVWSQFGDDVATILGTNPWALTRVDGISFQQADEIAGRLGLLSDSPFRLQGLIISTAKSRRAMGHIYMTTSQMISEIQLFFPDMPKADVGLALAECHKEGSIVIDREILPGVFAIYDPWSHKLEKDSAEKIHARLKTAGFGKGGLDRKDYIKRLASFGPDTEKESKKKRSSLEKVVSTAVEEWGKSNQLVLSAKQKEGAIHALTTPVSILTGLPGTGKCVTLDTLVSGSLGIRPIGSFLPPNAEVDAFYPCFKKIDTSDGEKETSAIFFGGKVPTIRIRTVSGYELEGTPEHPVRVVEDGRLVWRALQDLHTGDVPVLVKGGATFPNAPRELPVPRTESGRGHSFVTPTTMGPVLARILGYLTSEGSTRSETDVVITNYDSCVQDFLVQSFKDLFGIQAHYHLDARKPNHPVGVRFTCRRFVSWLRDIGVAPELSSEKTIPFSVLESEKTDIIAYLSSLFEGDGAVDSRRYTVEYGTASKKLASQIHVLLLSLGIVSTYLTGATSNGGIRYRILISGEDYDQFRDLIGFQFTEMPQRNRISNTNRHRLHQLHLPIKRWMHETSPKKGAGYNLIYRYGLPPSSSSHRKPSRAQLLRLLQLGSPESNHYAGLAFWLDPKWFHDPIVSVQSDFSEVADFTVPANHEFLSGGFISHNTTGLRAVVNILQEAGVKFLLCAPTGIAAKNLGVLTGAPASTIHRAFAARGISDEKRESSYTGVQGDSDSTIGFSERDEQWGFGPDNPYPAEVVIVDEASMLDQHLLYRLLECTSPSTRLVIVGDAAQLPSVGPGNVLRDLIKSELFPVTDLREIFRQKDTSAIVYAAHDIHKGDVPECTPGSDFSLFRTNSDTQALQVVLQIAEKLYARRNNFQILSPRHAGPVGVTSLNSRLRDLLNPPKDGLQEFRLGPEDVVREDDRIMVIRNDYNLGVYNGDVGKVVRVDQKSKEIEVKIFGAPVVQVRIAFKHAPNTIRLAYACTVHKAQGLEYDVIVMPLVDGFRHQLQRNLLYTAVTRAKQKVFLVGTYSALASAVTNDKEDMRNTLLKERLQRLEQHTKPTVKE